MNLYNSPGFPGNFRLIFALLILLTMFPLASAKIIGQAADDQAQRSDIIITLTFSTDNGQTWEADFPILENDQHKFKVKIDYRITEQREIENNLVLSRLYASDADFASCNRGRQSSSNTNTPQWMQRLDKYWANALSPGEFIYDLDLGERPAGVLGNFNLWDKDTGKFIHSLLPACPARDKGMHRSPLISTM